MKNLSLFLILLVASVACNQGSTSEEATVPENSPTEAKKVEEVTPSKENKKQLRHVVLFKFKDTATPEDIKLVEDAFQALPAVIPQIRAFEFGTNNSPEGLDKGFTHCFFLTFDSEEDRDAYLPHPEHKKFGSTLQPYLEDVLVVDYWTND